MTFFERIYRERLKMGLIRVDVANKVGVAHATMHGFETGKRYPRLDVAIKLCKFYGINFSEFYDMEFRAVGPDDFDFLSLERAKNRLERKKDRLASKLENLKAEIDNLKGSVT